MAGLSDFAENKILDWLLRGQAIGITGASAAAGTGPTNVWVGLLTATPSDVAGSGTEVSGGNYARQVIPSNMTSAGWSGTQSAGSTAVSSGTSGQISNNAAVVFPAPNANWGSCGWFALYDAVSGGNMLAWAALSVAKTVNNGDAAPQFNAAALTFTLD